MAGVLSTLIMKVLGDKSKTERVPHGVRVSAHPSTKDMKWLCRKDIEGHDKEANFGDTTVIVASQKNFGRRRAGLARAVPPDMGSHAERPDYESRRQVSLNATSSEGNAAECSPRDSRKRRTKSSATAW